MAWRWGGLAALLLVNRPAHAGDLDVRLDDGFLVRPYLTGQYDQASFLESAPQGQAAGGNLRRFQMGGFLDIYDQLSVGFIYDFGHSVGSSQRVLEGSFNYTGLKPFQLKLGITKPQFSMESVEDGADTVFMERASIVNVTRNIAASSGRLSGQVLASGPRWLAAAAVTGGITGRIDDGQQHAVVGRAVGLPIQTRSFALELGGSAQYVFRPPNLTGTGRSLSLSEFVELSIDPAPPSVATGVVLVRSATVAGPEASASMGRLLLQGEWYQITLNRSDSARSTVFNGGYVQAAYTVLGSPRAWDEGLGGVWAVPKAQASFNPAAGQWGAVEVAARYSTIDLQSSDIRGGRQDIWTAAVSWWPISPVRLTAEFLHADVSGGPSPRTVNAMAGRMQLHF